MGRRLPSDPPTLSGYTYVRALGTGGFADVYLYEQSMPRRTIAVKVLLPDAVDGDLRTAFLQETTMLAQLAAHPSVLTMYEAGIAPDGRPFLVTEYCPSNYGDRFRRGPIPVPEVLSVGIAVGSVLETAHRASVLHRDIKPANILVTGYGKPVLADFGIASTVARAETDQSVGISVPWSAPEVLNGTSRGSVETELWSFGATLYALLAGRSPYELPGGDNSREAIADRIRGRKAPRPIERADVPSALDELITACLSRDPSRRPASMHEALYSLQRAETELSLRPSTLEIPGETATELSRVLAAAASEPSAAVQADGTAGTGGTTGGTGGRNRVARRRVQRQRGTGAEDRTSIRTLDSAPSRRGVRSGLYGALGSVVAAGLVVGGIILFQPRGVPTVTELRATPAAEGVEFSWASAGEGSRYLVRVDGEAPIQQNAPGFRADAASGDRVCATVTVVLADGRVGEPSPAQCARSGPAE
ncbi:MAG: serine/threonine-protein kinase [Mycetocola sp.]